MANICLIIDVLLIEKIISAVSDSQRQKSVMSESNRKQTEVNSETYRKKVHGRDIYSE